MMKNHLSIYTALLLLGLAVPSAQAADVTITVNGSVVASPCTVSTKDVLVPFGTLYGMNFVTPMSSSEWKSFTLKLTNCPIGTSRVTATFSGTADGTNYFANQATQNSASNIQIELQDTNSTVIKNGTSKTLVVNDADKSVDIPLQARLVSVNGGATQGTVQSQITVTYQYQ